MRTSEPPSPPGSPARLEPPGLRDAPHTNQRAEETDSVTKSKEEKFADIVRRHSWWQHAYADTGVNASYADELVRDVLWSAWKQDVIAQCSGDAERIRKSLRQSIHDCVADELRRPRTVRELLDGYVCSLLGDDDYESYCRVFTTGVELLIDRALRELPRRCWLAFVLVRRQHNSYAAAADSLDMSVPALSAHLTRALRLVRRKLAAADYCSAADEVGTERHAIKYYYGVKALVRAELRERDHADYALVTDYLAGELPAAARERVDERLRTDAKFRALAEPLILVWSLSGPLDRVPNFLDVKHANHTWRSLKARIKLEREGIHTLTLQEKRAKRGRGRRIRLTIIAAAISGCVGGRISPQFFPALTLYVHMQAPDYEMRFTKLPDETQVAIAPLSHLTYLRWFSKSDERTLNLDGEGTFTVAPGPRRARVVAGPGVEVKATEGRFTVQAYSAISYAYVKVHEGSAEVRARTLYGNGAVLTLRAGDGARIGPGLRIERVDPPIAAWTTDRKRR